MARVLVSIAAASMVLVAMPTDVGARSFRSMVRHTIGMPLGIIGGIMGTRHRVASRHRHGARAHRVAAVAPTASDQVASRTTEEPVAGADPGASPDSSYRPWASAYDDIFGFVLTPSGHGEAFWRHGAADLHEALIPPGASLPRADPKTRGGRIPGAAPVATCPERRPDGIAGWPMEQVERTLKPTGQQHQGLESLHAALDHAFDLAQASCSAAAPRSSVDRLDALRKRVAAMRMVRPPLGDLYASLSDEQKARLNAASRQVVVDASASDARAQASEAERLMRACAADAGGTVQSALGQLQQTVQPTADQRPGLEILAGTFGHVAELLKASCPADMPLTPTGRINAAEKRLRVMLYAISILRGPLDRFYASLNAEQKSRFDAGASPPQPGNRRRADARPHG
jgi:LTXXQ motif family protein